MIPRDPEPKSPLGVLTGWPSMGDGEAQLGRLTELQAKGCTRNSRPTNSMQTENTFILTII